MHETPVGLGLRSLGPTGPSVPMSTDPSVDPSPAPDPARGQRHLRCGEVLVLPCDLVGALTGDAEHLGDLRHTDKVMAHAGSLPETLDRRYPSLILLR